MDVRGLAQIFKWMGYLALAVAILVAAGLTALILAIWHWTA